MDKSEERLKRINNHLIPSVSLQVSEGDTTDKNLITSPSQSLLLYEEAQHATFHRRSIESFMNSSRFNYTTRYHSVDDVVRLSTSSSGVSRSADMSHKLYNLLRSIAGKSSILSMGCMDSAQAVLIARYASMLYVSGWQTSCSSSTDGYPGPDLADYPYDSVPTMVSKINKALQWHSQRQNQRRATITNAQKGKELYVDYDW